MAEKRKTLADAFGLEPEEPEQPQVDEPTVDESEEEFDTPTLSEDGVVRFGEQEFVYIGDKLLPVNASAQVNLTITALERHEFMQMAKEEGVTMVKLFRDALKLLKEKKKR